MLKIIKVTNGFALKQYDDQGNSVKILDGVFATEEAASAAIVSLEAPVNSTEAPQGEQTTGEVNTSGNTETMHVAEYPAISGGECSCVQA